MSILLIVFAIGMQLLFAQENARSPEAGQAFNEGLNLAKKQKYDDATVQFKKAIEADDNFPDAHYMLGYCYRKLNNFPEAEKEFKKAISLDSKFEKSYIALANLQSAADRSSDATNTFNAVISFNENSPRANYGLGKIYYDQKKYTQSHPAREKAVQVQGTYVFGNNF